MKKHPILFVLLLIAGAVFAFFLLGKRSSAAPVIAAGGTSGGSSGGGTGGGLIAALGGGGLPLILGGAGRGGTGATANFNLNGLVQSAWNAITGIGSGIANWFSGSGSIAANPVASSAAIANFQDQGLLSGNAGTIGNPNLSAGLDSLLYGSSDPLSPFSDNTNFLPDAAAGIDSFTPPSVTPDLSGTLNDINAINAAPATTDISGFNDFSAPPDFGGF